MEITKTILFEEINNAIKHHKKISLELVVKGMGRSYEVFSEKTNPIENLKYRMKFIDKNFTENLKGKKDEEIKVKSYAVKGW